MSVYGITLNLLDVFPEFMNLYQCPHHAWLDTWNVYMHSKLLASLYQTFQDAFYKYYINCWCVRKETQYISLKSFKGLRIYFGCTVIHLCLFFGFQI